MNRAPLAALLFIPLVAGATPATRQNGPAPAQAAPILTRSLPAGSHPVADSVVLVQVYRSRFDRSLPWRQEAVESSLGSGFFIAGCRIVTNAHVVADARQVLVRRHDQAHPYVARVA